MSNSAPVQRLRVLDAGYFQTREDTSKKIIISGIHVDPARNELLISDLYNKRIKRAATNREPFTVQNIYASAINQFACGVTRLKVGKEVSKFSLLFDRATIWLLMARFAHAGSL